jgi:hypothetical protein
LPEDVSISAELQNLYAIRGSSKVNAPPEFWGGIKTKCNSHIQNARGQPTKTFLNSLNIIHKLLPCIRSVPMYVNWEYYCIFVIRISACSIYDVLYIMDCYIMDKLMKYV